MTHAKSLRVIGQSLEVARLEAFELEKHDQYYVVQSDSLTQTGEWILRNALSEDDFSHERSRPSTPSRSLRFTPVDISRLDAQAQKNRRNQSFSHNQVAKKLSQLLRALGDHLDRSGASSFHISWTAVSVFVDFQEQGGQSDVRTFTAEKLQQLGSHARFRRSSR